MKTSYLTRVGARIEGKELEEQVKNGTIGLGQYTVFTCRGAFLLLTFFGILCPLLGIIWTVSWPFKKAKELAWKWTNKIRIKITE